MTSASHRGSRASALFQAYKLIKNGENQGKSREDICSALREKFGEKNPEMQVLH